MGQLDWKVSVLPEWRNCLLSSETVKLSSMSTSMTMSESYHVNRPIMTFFYRLSRLKCIRQSLKTSTGIQLVNSFIILRVDYCNSIQAGLPKYQLDRMKSVHSQYCARLIFGRGRHDHVTPLLWDRLHWLLVPQRVEFEDCLHVCLQSVEWFGPRLLVALLFQHVNNYRRSSLRSSTIKRLVNPPRSRTTTYGERVILVRRPSSLE